MDWYSQKDNSQTIDALNGIKRLNSLWSEYLLINPNDADALIIHGKYCRAIGDYKSAYESFQKADLLDDNLAVVKQQLAALEGEDGNFEKSYAHLKSAIALAPDVSIYHKQMGQLLILYKEDLIKSGVLSRESWNREFSDSYAKASALNPKSSELKWAYAQSFYDLDNADWQKALKIWDELLKDSNFILEKETINANRARVLIELYKDSEAHEVLKTVTHPDLQRAKMSMLAVIAQAKISSEQKRNQDSLDHVLPRTADDEALKNTENLQKEAEISEQVKKMENNKIYTH